MLYTPVNISVVPKFRCLASVKANTIGMNVPKSPMAPFISAHFDRKTKLLFTFFTKVAVWAEAGGRRAFPGGGRVFSGGWWCGWESMGIEAGENLKKGPGGLCLEYRLSILKGE